jgi:hypothetical protein
MDPSGQPYSLLSLHDSSPVILWLSIDGNGRGGTIDLQVSVVFASPRCQNLRLLGTERRPVREMLYIWPDIPDKRLEDEVAGGEIRTTSLLHHITCAHQPPSRRCATAAMQVPFPELTFLRSQPSLERSIGSSASRFFPSLGWICPTSPNAPVGWRPIPGNAEADFAGCLVHLEA